MPEAKVNISVMDTDVMREVLADYNRLHDALRVIAATSDPFVGELQAIARAALEQAAKPVPAA